MSSFCLLYLCNVVTHGSLCYTKRDDKPLHPEERRINSAVESCSPGRLSFEMSEPWELQDLEQVKLHLRRRQPLFHYEKQQEGRTTDVALPSCSPRKGPMCGVEGHLPQGVPCSMHYLSKTHEPDEPPLRFVPASPRTAYPHRSSILSTGVPSAEYAVHVPCPVTFVVDCPPQDALPVTSIPHLYNT